MNNEYDLLRIINSLRFRYNDLQLIVTSTKYIFSESELIKLLKNLSIQECIIIRDVEGVTQVGITPQGIRKLVGVM